MHDAHYKLIINSDLSNFEGKEGFLSGPQGAYLGCTRRIPGTGEPDGLPPVYGVAQSRTRLKQPSSSSSRHGASIQNIGASL